MLVSFRINKEYEELMKRLAKEGNRTKWLNEAVALYFHNHHVDGSNNPALLEKLEEIKSLLLAMQDSQPTQAVKTKETEISNEEDEFFQLLSTGFNQGI